ncbi:MAG: bifunctional 5,10-methylenetetrahydrofolate dehydrogenase/5,10-methenyltetrahydrofolate cyclohydrolase [Candidatus Harrisonbacteria bacterium]|nr:bifunctional 5,10-methylenetetrahydrofolate dehydrogenase/5,10-methenyltetrahydrofolate cyclohydrolase [Candidatus Harrisonbacteria bacterium]
MIDGKVIAGKISAELKQQKIPSKKLVAVLVGSDPASLSFIKQKARVAEELGVKFEIKKFSSTLSQSALEKSIKRIAQDKKVGGFIIQLPLPKKYNRTVLLNAIGIEKDIDLLNGENSRILAPAAGALERILKSVRFSPKGKRVVVIGSGLLVGQPVVRWLMDRCAQLTVMNKGGLDKAELRRADLIVTGAGHMNLIRGGDIKKNAVLIDFGYAKAKGQLHGDIDFKSVSKKTSFITPTPGGTGPVVVAMLLWNFFHLNT